MTSVEWFAEQIKDIDFTKIDTNDFLTCRISLRIFNEKLEQAKQMEKEQLKEMYLKGIENYDPTFKKK